MTDEADAVHELAIRPLPRRAPVTYAGPRNVRLLGGRVPDNLPFRLPVPASCTIIGSQIDRPVVTIVLDTDLPPRRALEFYREALTGHGWTMLETGRARGGFEQASHSHGVFCLGADGPRLTLNAHAAPEEATEIRLDIDLTDTPCEWPALHQPPQIGPIPSLPELAPPAGAELRPMGGEASPVGTSANAELITALDMDGVASHYAAQIHEAGCVERDHGQGIDLTWSIWDLEHPDHGPSRGLFLAMRSGDDGGRYFLYIRVAWASSDRSLCDGSRADAGRSCESTRETHGPQGKDLRCQLDGSEALGASR